MEEWTEFDRRSAWAVSAVTLGIAALVVIHTELSGAAFSGAKITLVGLLAAVVLLAPVMCKVRRIGVRGLVTAELQARKLSTEIVTQSPAKVEEPELDGDPEEAAGEEERARVAEILARVRGVEAAGASLDALGYASLARQLRRAGRYAEAVRAYEQAYELNPLDRQSLNSAGVILSRHLGQYDKAAQSYRRLIAEHPDFLSPLYNLACNEARRGDNKAALTLLAAAIQGDTKYRELARRDEAFQPLRSERAFTDLLT